MVRRTITRNKETKQKKRKRYGSFAWTDKKTGLLYARVRIAKDDGSVKTVYKRALNVTHAEQLAEEIKAEYETRGQAFIDGRKMQFKDLAKWYKEQFVIAPVYVNGQKIEGMRTWVAERSKIDRICDDLGENLINEIDDEIFRAFRRKRLKSGVTVTTVNRDFETIRAMFRKAKKKKWTKEVPDFDDFIHKSLERRRRVTITDDQERRILGEAKKILRTSAPRLYALILALRDSGARPNELYPVNDYESDYSSDNTFYEPIRWRDLFDDAGNIRDISQLVSFKGKEREVRLAVVTERMKSAFLELWEFLQRSKTIPGHAASIDNLVFPHTSFKKSWDTVRKAASVPDLRLRDLRRDWVTRLARLGYSDKLAQRGAGQKTMQMSYHYTEFDFAAAIQAKAVLDTDNSK